MNNVIEPDQFRYRRLLLTRLEDMSAEDWKWFSRQLALKALQNG